MLFPPEAQKEVGVEARQLVTMMHRRMAVPAQGNLRSQPVPARLPVMR
jgi:hypothetical protein